MSKEIPVSLSLKCINCNRLVKANVRLKGKQKYCGRSECQRERRKRWYRKKIKTDSAYSTRQKQSKKKWRDKKPAHEYQRDYRATHPEYVESNRQKQRERSRRRQGTINKQTREKIVKIDALKPEALEKTKIYRMRILGGEKIVKIDTLIVQLQEYKGLNSTMSQTFQ